jgi:hypothetical protein
MFSLLFWSLFFVGFQGCAGWSLWTPSSSDNDIQQFGEFGSISIPSAKQVHGPSIAVTAAGLSCGSVTNASFIQFVVSLTSSFTTDFNCDTSIKHSNCSTVSFTINRHVCDVNSKKKSLETKQNREDTAIPATIVCQGVDGMEVRVWVEANSFQDELGNPNSAGSSCIVRSDKTAPSLTSLSITSSNSDPSVLAVGDSLFLDLEFSEPVRLPNVRIMDHEATVTPSDHLQKKFRATIQVSNTGVVTYSVNFVDLAGNQGTTFTHMSAASQQTENGETTTDEQFTVVTSDSTDDKKETVKLEGVSIAIIAGCVFLITVLYSIKFIKSNGLCRKSRRNENVVTDRPVAMARRAFVDVTPK